MSTWPQCTLAYDGTFTGTLRDGAGLFAQALMDAGIRVIDVEEL